MTNLCGLCGKTESEHAELMHGFSPDGDLIERVEKPRRVAVASSQDWVLRTILLEKGIITQEELAAKEVQLRDQFQARRNSYDPPDA